MGKYLKGRYWKRRLALFLAVSMILTTNVFSIDAVSVYAAQTGDEISDEVVSPAEGAADAEDFADAPEAGVPDSREAEDSVDAPDAGDMPDSGEAEDLVDAPGAGDMSDSEEAGDSAETPDAEEAEDSIEALDSAEAGDSTDTSDATEGENAVAENYSAVGLNEEEFEAVRQDVDILWQPVDVDGEEKSPYDDRWRGGADTETLLAEIFADGNYEYAYLQPRNPNIEDRTINIPDTIKGVIIDTGWCEDSNGNEGSEDQGYSFDIPVDVLNINGTSTYVYFRKGSCVDAGDSNILSIHSPENNTNKVVFEDNLVNAVIDYVSESGTIVFVGSSIINGYITKSTTQFCTAEPSEGEEKADNADLMIREAGGLSFEEITGDVNVSIIFNGYPENNLEENLPYFNKEISLGKGTDGESGEEYDRGVTISFREYKEQPFWLDESNGEDWNWWEEVPTQALEKGTQIAYFAGTSRNEKSLIGCRVYYYEHGNEENVLFLDPSTGRLEQEDVEAKRAAYAVLELDETSYNAVKVNTDLIFSEGNDYGELWDETDTLDEYLKSREYVVIQATKTSHDLEDKTLVLPENIKGALFVHDWDAETGRGLEWQLNTLKVNAGTEVYMNDISINTMGQDFNIELEDNTSKVVFGGQCIVNAVVKCESESGTIEFVQDNIVNGYITMAGTRFSAPEPLEGETKLESANLLIREAAGLSFEEITGDVDVFIIFNGYLENPENPDWLPHFNKEIDLGEAADENAEGGKRDRNVTINFWERMNEPFWLGAEEGQNWWNAVPAEDLGAGTQAAYFAGTTIKEKEAISCRVGYWNHSKPDEENNLFISYTGRLEHMGEEEEICVYRVLNLNNIETFNAVKVNVGNVYDDSYNEQWDETDMLSEYLKSSGLEYVVIQAVASSYELDDKALELPENIKGVILLSEHREEDQTAEWKLNTIKAEGSKEIYICDASINPMGQEPEAPNAAQEDQGFKIETTAAGVNVVIEFSEIMGDLSVSGIADIKFIDSNVFGAIDLGNGKTTKVGLEGQLVADNLSGYLALEINGDTTLIVRYHGAVVIENSSFNKTNAGSDEGQSLNLIYNGYPADASLLPEFGDNIVFPDNCGITLRFVQQSDDVFWEGDWWDKTPDELLPLGSQIATVSVDGDKFGGLMQKFCYWSNAQNTENIELVRDETSGALCIQKLSETGKRVVDFLLSAGNTKTYDGAAFAVSESDVANNCGYTGSVELAWTTKAGTELEQAPKDAGEYILKMSVPADAQDFEGETQANITITPKTVTVSVKPSENKADGYEIIWTGFVGDETYTTQAVVVTGDEITEDGKKYHMVSTKDGDAGGNYTIVHADPVKIAIKEVLKPVINSVLFPKNKDSYSAVYTGEQIRPVMVVAYKYTDGSRQKTQKLKLNVDYILTYENNVNVTDETHAAKVTVRGIGEYAGVITKEFSITPKSIKKVTLSAVGDIIFGSEPVVTVMDGSYELVKDKDYELVLSTLGSGETDTQSELTVKGKGNYNETANKKVKFNILRSAAAASTEIKSIAAEGVTLELKNPAKVYTYNGKAIKPAVVVKDGGIKVPANQYKVIYTNNVDAGTQTAAVKVVGVTKKGKGYYGVSKELKFDIKQKDFVKVSVSSIAAVPKTPNFDGVTMTVKDGKRILTENVDYTVDYSNILNMDGTFKGNIVTGQKYALILKPVGGKNYVDTSTKTVYVKFGQLNLASKTANISVKIKDASKDEVEVMYNGVLLTKDTDYTAQVKPDNNNSTYTVTIKAVKKSAYKGKRVIKNLTAPTT